MWEVVGKRRARLEKIKKYLNIPVTIRRAQNMRTHGYSLMGVRAALPPARARNMARTMNIPRVVRKTRNAVSDEGSPYRRMAQFRSPKPMIGMPPPINSIITIFLFNRLLFPCSFRTNRKGRMYAIPQPMSMAEAVRRNVSRTIGECPVH